VVNWLLEGLRIESELFWWRDFSGTRTCNTCVRTHECRLYYLLVMEWLNDFVLVTDLIVLRPSVTGQQGNTTEGIPCRERCISPSPFLTFYTSRIAHCKLLIYDQSTGKIQILLRYTERSTTCHHREKCLDVFVCLWRIIHIKFV
jgi:hypothetical protein